jgi:hypothetical protein
MRSIVYCWTTIVPFDVATVQWNEFSLVIRNQQGVVRLFGDVPLFELENCTL